MDLRLGGLMDAGSAGAAFQLVGRLGALADLDMRPVALQVALRKALGDGGSRVLLRQFDLAGGAAVRHWALGELELEVGGRALLPQIDSGRGRAVVVLVQALAGRRHSSVQAANVVLLLVLGARRMSRRGDCVGVAVVTGVMVEGRAL